MGNATDELTNNESSTSASARVICEEFLKVLGRKEVEHPMIWYVQTPSPQTGYSPCYGSLKSTKTLEAATNPRS
jgi:hypothetical protein